MICAARARRQPGVGRLPVRSRAVHRSAQPHDRRRAPSRMAGVDATATFIVGGQIGDEGPEILLVYPEGNYIRASDELPFLQIGEAKYGKFLLEMAVHFHVDAETAIKIALGSMMSTARANLSVGPPYDLAIYRDDSFGPRSSGSRPTPRSSPSCRRPGSSGCMRASPSCRASTPRACRPEPDARIALGAPARRARARRRPRRVPGLGPECDDGVPARRRPHPRAGRRRLRGL